MNACKGQLFVAGLIVCFLPSVGMCQDAASDFEQALQTVDLYAGQPLALAYYDQVEEAADAFVQEHRDQSAVGLLTRRVDDPNSKKVALLCLAKLSSSNEPARSAFFQQVRGPNPGALVAIGYLPPAQARELAQALLREPGPWHVRRPAAEALVGLGDEQSLSLLEQVKVDEKDPIVKEAVERVTSELAHKLNEVLPEDRDEWGQQETRMWRTLPQHVRPSRGGDIGWRAAARQLLLADLRFSRAFLRHKLEMRDPLAIAIIGTHKEVWAIRDLMDHVTQGDIAGDLARESLAEIGTDEALRGLEASLAPDGNPKANTRLIMLLQRCGDARTAEFMDHLSLDERYPARLRASFAYTAAAIRRRLAVE